MSILSQNLRSINAGFPKLQDYLQESKTIFDIVCCQETWKINSDYILDGYQNPIYTERKTKRGGGIINWVKKGINVESVDKFNIFLEGHYESHVISLKLKNKNICLVNFYRPPNGDCKKFIQAINQQVQNIQESGREAIFLGDANINMLQNSKVKAQLENVLLSSDMMQIVQELSLIHISEPTRPY